MLDTLDLAAVQADIVRRTKILRYGSRLYILGILAASIIAILTLYTVDLRWLITASVLFPIVLHYLYMFTQEQRRLKAARPILREVIPNLPPRLPSPALPWNALTLIGLGIGFYLFLGLPADFINDVRFLLLLGVHTVWLFFFPALIFSWLFHGPYWRADYEGAIRRVQQLKRFMPWSMRLESTQGNFLLAQGRDAEAATLYYAILPFFQNDRFSMGAALCNLGYAKLRQGDASGAFPYVQAAAQIMPENADLLHGLAFYYLDQEVHLERGLEIMEYILSAHPRPQNNTYLQLNQWRGWKGTEARLLMLLGKQARADAAIDEMFAAADPALIPGLADAHLDAGFARKTQGNLDAAQKHFEQALQLDPKGYNARVAQAELDKLT